MKNINRILLTLVLGFSITGCTTAMLAGKSGTRFEASLQDVYDAALSTLEEDKMPILRKTIGTTNAQIDSEYPNGTHLRVVIKEMSPSYIQTSVRVGAFNDDSRAYDLMKKIEARVKK